MLDFTQRSYKDVGANTVVTPFPTSSDLHTACRTRKQEHSSYILARNRLHTMLLVLGMQKEEPYKVDIPYLQCLAHGLLHQSHIPPTPTGPYLC